jgi:hypothetical protein
MTDFMNKKLRRVPTWSTLLLSTLLLAGCGGSDGPPRYDLTGSITFGGNPIPRGSLTFSPDSSQGNSGPGATAGIIDGKYTTQEGKGVISGAHIVVVQAYDGVPVETDGEGMDPNGTSLFPSYTMQISVPENGGTLDIEVPGDAATSVNSRGNAIDP